MNDETERALDGYLIALIQGGSREAFDRLVRRWTPKLVRYATRVQGRPELARDIVQETWVAAIRGMKDSTTRRDFPHGSTALRTGNASMAFGSINDNGV